MGNDTDWAPTCQIRLCVLTTASSSSWFPLAQAGHDTKHSAQQEALVRWENIHRTGQKNNLGVRRIACVLPAYCMIACTRKCRELSCPNLVAVRERPTRPQTPTNRWLAISTANSIHSIGVPLLARQGGHQSMMHDALTGMLTCYRDCQWIGTAALFYSCLHLRVMHDYTTATLFRGCSPRRSPNFESPDHCNSRKSSINVRWNSPEELSFA